MGKTEQKEGDPPVLTKKQKARLAAEERRRVEEEVARAHSMNILCNPHFFTSGLVEGWGWAPEGNWASKSEVGSRFTVLTDERSCNSWEPVAHNFGNKIQSPLL